MGFIVVLFVLWFLFMAGSGSKKTTEQKGSFKVTGFKNGEVVFVRTYVDESFTLVPGTKFDRVEITEVPQFRVSP